MQTQGWQRHEIRPQASVRKNLEVVRNDEEVAKLGNGILSVSRWTHVTSPKGRKTHGRTILAHEGASGRETTHRERQDGSRKVDGEGETVRSVHAGRKARC